MDTPKTLQQAILFFSDPDNCVAYMKAKRWPDGVVVCPTCGRNDVSWLANQRKWQCKSKHGHRQFSVKVGTIFEDSPIGLDKWLMASWLLANCKNGVSSYEIARSLGITQKSAWFMMHRIRMGMRQESPAPLGEGEENPVEIDEAYIGGKPKNMHLKKRLQSNTALNGYANKTVIMGMLERKTREVRAKVIPNAKRETLQKEILAGVGFGSTIYTDGWPGYDGLARKQFVHETVNHMNEYVRGEVHTQSIENFWSLLKRGLNGTYIAVEPFHMDRYLDEQMFRFNNRIRMGDGQRFDKLMGRIAGKRLTYKELTGKTEDAARQGETGPGPQ